jgi:hypothetical protein
MRADMEVKRYGVVLKRPMCTYHVMSTVLNKWEFFIVRN